VNELRKTRFHAKNIPIGLFAFTLVTITFNAFIHPAQALQPRIYLDPSNNTYNKTTPVGTKFNVTVWCADIPVDIAGAQITLHFNDTILNVTAWYVPSLSDQNFFYYGATKITALPDPPDPGYVHVDAGHGYIKVAVLNGYLPPKAPWGHNGTIAIIEFNITKTPSDGQLTSSLSINNIDTYLKDPSNVNIPGVTIEDGSYTIIPEYTPVIALSFFITSTAIVILLRKKKIIQRLN
jgi:hypothetical protein